MGSRSFFVTWLRRLPPTRKSRAKKQAKLFDSKVFLASMPGGVTLWKLIRVLGGGELLEKTLAPVLPSEQLDFEFTRLPVILAAYSAFLKSWPHPTYRALMSERNLGRKFFLAEFVVYIETILGHAN